MTAAEAAANGSKGGSSAAASSSAERVLAAVASLSSLDDVAPVASFLRRAVRVVHCLQKERGASCALSAASSGAGSSSQPNMFVNAVESARNSTDAAVNAFCTAKKSERYDGNDEFSIREPLKRIRILVDASTSIGENWKKKSPPRPRDGGGIGAALANAPPLPTCSSSAKDVNSGTCDTTEDPIESDILHDSSDGQPGRKQNPEPNQPVGFHRILVAFNGLVSNVVHVYIVQRVKHLQRQIQVLLDSEEQQTKMQSGVEAMHLRSSSQTYVQPSANGLIAPLGSSLGVHEHKPARFMAGPSSLDNSVWQQKVRSQQGASASETMSPSPFPLNVWSPSSFNCTPPHPCLGSSLGVLSTTHPPGKLFGTPPAVAQNEFKPSTPISRFLAESKRAGSDGNLADLNSTKSQDWVDGVCIEFQAKVLLSLLLSFVRLKESTGVERAVLSSLMAMSNGGGGSKEDWIDETEHHRNTALSPLQLDPGVQRSMLFSDLVLEVENQRTIVRDLRNKTRRLRQRSSQNGGGASIPSHNLDENYKSLLSLVEESVELQPALRMLQDHLRSNFDIRSIQQAMSMDEFWAHITLYIDKLHALELLLLEELEMCMGMSRTSDGRRRWSKMQDSNSTLVSVDRPLSSPDEHEAPCQLSSKGEKVFGNTDKSNFAPNSNQPNLQSILGVLKPPGYQGDDPVSRDEIANLIDTMTLEQTKEALFSLLKNVSADLTTQPDSATSDSKPETGDGDAIEEEKRLPIQLSSGPTTNDANPPAASKEWQIDLYEVEFQKRVGRGSAGTTYLASWRGQDVAVKVATITDMGLDGWNAEIRSLQRLHHPNIIRLLGSIYNQSPLTYCLVLEFCDAGELSTALLKRTPANFFFRVARNIANGLAYLHSRNVCHRDVKPSNVLLHGDVLKGDFTAKLTDFGVSTMMMGQSSEEHTAETGTYRWMAPEVVRHEWYSFKADVYSFSLVVWQLITREEPFCKVSQIEAAGMVALEMARPPFPRDVPREVQILIESCWSENPDDRFTFDVVCQQLSELEATLSAGDRSWLEEPYGHPVYDIPVVKSKEERHTKTDFAQMSHSEHMSKDLVHLRSNSWHARKDDRKQKSEKKTGFRSIFTKKK